MHAPVAALAAAAALAASAVAGAAEGTAGNGDARLAALPGSDLVEIVQGALAPPPTTVVRETRYYGTVTIDHRAHLARRSPCLACHGPGPVQKIEFTPKIAHERCIGCHQQVAKGPDKCQGCHVRPPPPPAELAAERAPEEPAKPPQPPGPNPDNVAAALAAFEAPPREQRRDPFARRVEVALSAGRGLGAAFRFFSTQDDLVLSQGIELFRSSGAGRTLALLGAGVCRPLNRDIVLETSALAGFDVFDRPVAAVLPVVGLRTAIQARQPGRFLQHYTVSLSGLADLSQRAFGREIGGFTLYGSVATGLRVP